jgi:peptide/nickel transport system permease protein
MTSIEAQPRRAAMTSIVARHPWADFALRRAAGLVCVLIVLVILTFSLVRLLPGDPAVAIVGINGTPAAVHQIDAQLGLDKPWASQLVTFTNGILHGQLGTSFSTDEPVTSVLRERIGVSARIAGLALLAVMLISVPLGLAVAALTRDHRHRHLDALFTSVSSVGGAIPDFLLATLFALIFGVFLRVLPVASLNGWNSYILPVAAIAIRPTFVLMRIVRIEALNVLRQDYIRTAESKRLPKRIIYVRHVLPNSVTAALSIGGILFAGLISGAVVVENVFALPGLGTALVNSVINHDYPVTQGIVLALGVIVVAVNTLVDFALAVIDPRSLTKAG